MVIARIRDVAALGHELDDFAALNTNQAHAQRLELQTRIDTEKVAIRGGLDSLGSRANTLVVSASRLAIPAIMAGWNRPELSTHLQEAVNRAVERVRREQASQQSDAHQRHPEQEASSPRVDPVPAERSGGT